MGTEGSEEVDIENGDGAVNDCKHAGCIRFAMTNLPVNGQRGEGVIGDV